MATQDARPRTVKEAAEELGLSRQTIYAWIAKRRISYVRLGKAIRILPSEIAHVLEAGTVTARITPRKEPR
jgi:excisionase family DNA binding protein